MSRTLRIPEDVQIKLEQEGLKIDVPAGGNAVHTVILPRGSRDEAQGQKLLQDLRRYPRDLAEFIDKGPEALRSSFKRLDIVPPWRSGTTKKSQHEPHDVLAMAYADVVWERDPSLQLDLLGWTREALIAAVWEAWEQAAPLPNADAALLKAAGQLDAATRGTTSEGPSTAEWLAEMAEQGRLHLPGPQFHDVVIGLQIVDPGSNTDIGASMADETGALLPGVPGAAKGHSLVAAQVSLRAEELAAPLRNRLTTDRKS
ncbi:hypothetical protein D3C78_795880 [compost metagenome]